MIQDLRDPPWVNRSIPSSGFLGGVRWFENDVSGLPIGPIFKDQDIQKVILGRHVA
jgi:hypothetical protein